MAVQQDGGVSHGKVVAGLAELAKAGAQVRQAARDVAAEIAQRRGEAPPQPPPGGQST